MKILRIANVNSVLSVSQKMPGQVDEHKTKRATFGMGCFWAGDSLFGATPGVIRTCVGYAGGVKPSPTYRSMYVSSTIATDDGNEPFDVCIITL